MKMDEQIAQAVKILHQGGIVIFPTDTAFGIGCRMDNEATIERVFTIRKRPESQATPVLVSDREMAEKYLQPIHSKEVQHLMKTHWPGGLTLVLPCREEKVPML